MESLEAAIHALDACLRTGRLGVEEDEVFHALVCAASDNQYFEAARASMKSNIITGMNLTRSLSLKKSMERLQLVQTEHYAILDALRSQDADAARRAMRAHIDNARSRVFEGST